LYANNFNDFFDFSAPKPFVKIDLPTYALCNDTARTRNRPRLQRRSSRWLRMIGYH